MVYDACVDSLVDHWSSLLLKAVSQSLFGSFQSRGSNQVLLRVPVALTEWRNSLTWQDVDHWASFGSLVKGYDGCRIQILELNCRKLFCWKEVTPDLCPHGLSAWREASGSRSLAQEKEEGEGSGLWCSRERLVGPACGSNTTWLLNSWLWLMWTRPSDD